MSDQQQVQLSAATMRTLMRELKQLSTTSPFDDIYVDCDSDALHTIDAIINGPASTPFDNGQFRVKMHITPDYPQTPPKAYFVTKIFHPNVAPSTGEICVNTLKRDWVNTYGLQHIVQVIRSLLIQPNPESALNEEAGKLLLENYDDYHRRAAMMTKIHAKMLMDIKAKLGKQADSTTQTDGATKQTSSDKENSSSAQTGTSDSATIVKPAAVSTDKPKPAAAAKKNLKRL